MSRRSYPSGRILSALVVPGPLLPSSRPALPSSRPGCGSARAPAVARRCGSGCSPAGVLANRNPTGTPGGLTLGAGGSVT